MSMDNISDYNERLTEVCALINQNKNLNISLPLADVIKNAGKLIEDSFGVESYSIMLLDDSNENLSLLSADAATMSMVQDIRVSIGEGVCGSVALNGEPIIINEVSKDARLSLYNGINLSIGSFYCTPLRAGGGQLIGVLNIHKVEPRSITSQELVLYNHIAEHITNALENSRMFHEMRNMAISDELTRLYSRRYFNESFTKELSRAKRRWSDLAVVIFDLDFFKLVNDRFGHIAGDRVLEKFGQILLSNIRQGDIAARYGGEEFVLLLPDVDTIRAHAIAEKVRKLAEDELKVIEEGEMMASVTISGGVANYPSGGKTTDELLMCADNNLLEAKSSGKNRIYPLLNIAQAKREAEKRAHSRYGVGLGLKASSSSVKSINIQENGRWVLCMVDDVSSNGFGGMIQAELSIGTRYDCRAITENAQLTNNIFNVKLVRNQVTTRGRHQIGVEIVDNIPGWKEIITLISTH